MVLQSCINEREETYEALPLVFQKPSNFPEAIYDLKSNPITDKGFELGKKLFYDGRLSGDGTISCAFCHIQKHGFTHHGHRLSHGINGGEGVRNSQPIQNLAFQDQFAWDGATGILDLFPIIPITNEKEMGSSLKEIVSKLRKDPSYRKLFNAAFDNGLINGENILKAFAQFMVMMVSANSKYDRYVRNEPNGTLTEKEKKGLQVFKNKCASCHATDLFTDNSFRNNGLPVDPTLNDLGRMRVTFTNEEDKYKFKVPSLRNVALTGPYMHDGRFGSLESVLDFYSDGVQETQNLDPLLKQESGRPGINLTPQEKENIIAFLKTLTDEEFITDERFAE